MQSETTQSKGETGPLVSEDENAMFQDRRASLRGSHGESYDSLRSRLKPRYARVWAEILAAWALMASFAAGLAIVNIGDLGFGVQAAIGVLGAAAIGFLIAFLALWFHEAAHFNIHPHRGWNDGLANLAIGLLIAQDIKRYRTIHFGHHRRLGQVDDPEFSYFQPLDGRFLFEGLTGIAPLRVLLAREKRSAVDDEPGYLNYMTGAGAVFHCLVVGAAFWASNHVLALAWFAGVVVVYPFLGAVRQLLEHRASGAKPSMDFTRTPHGAYSRTFGNDFFARTFGAAGFNRHLLHHWDLQISCTRFDEFEAFILDSQLGDFYRSRKTTYLWAFKDLYGAG